VLDVAPGADSPEHRHAGPVFGYVLEGSLIFAVDEDPEREIAAGGSFVESEGALHRVFRGGEEGAKVLAIIVAEPGATLTTPP
ncbi:MAG: cupin domain-containing protein, partial [Acidobacteriota bacterium]